MTPEQVRDTLAAVLEALPLEGTEQVTPIGPDRLAITFGEHRAVISVKVYPRLRETA